MRSVLVLLALFVTGCGGQSPRYVASTCDFLQEPEKYVGQNIELTGTVVRLKNREWQFSTYCKGDVVFPLTWQKGARIPTDIGDLSRAGNQILSERNTVAGRIASDGKNGWRLEAKDYFRMRYTL